MNSQTWQLSTKLRAKSRTSYRYTELSEQKKIPLWKTSHVELWSLSGAHPPTERQRGGHEKKDCETDVQMHAFLTYLYSVELHHGSMLSVSHHSGLDHLPESCFLLQQNSKRLSVKQTNDIKFQQTQLLCVFMWLDVVLLCPVRWGCPSVCRSPLTGRGLSDPDDPPGQTWVYTDRRAQKCGAAAAACSSEPWWRFPAGGCTPWEPLTNHTCWWALLQQGCWNNMQLHFRCQGDIKKQQGALSSLTNLYG